MALMEWAIDVPQILLQCDASSDNLLKKEFFTDYKSVVCTYYFCLSTIYFFFRRSLYIIE